VPFRQEVTPPKSTSFSSVTSLIFRSQTGQSVLCRSLELSARFYHQHLYLGIRIL
jgi:hypothetical protein